MKSEELFIILASWFLGMLAVGMSLAMNYIFYKSFRLTYFDLMAFIFWGFSIYFLLKYTGLIHRKKKEDKNA
jgi:hypothetical protein